MPYMVACDLSVELLEQSITCGRIDGALCYRLNILAYLVDRVDSFSELSSVINPVICCI